MSRYAYDRLTFLDNSFLIMEKANTPMHIAGTATYDAAPLTKADGGIDIDRIRAYVESRLHLIPRYRQRPAAELVPQRAGLGRLRALQHPLPRAPHGAAEARRRAAAQAPGGAHHVAAPRPLQAAVGDLGRRGARRRRARRDDQQDPPLHGRRRLERRPAQRAADAVPDRRSSSPRRRTCRARRRRSWTC